MTQDLPRYFVRTDEVPGYHPANHTGTLNRRLIGRETVGATQLEVVHGTIEKGKGALPHAHPGIEQVCYLLQGPRAPRSAASRANSAPATAVSSRPTPCMCSPCSATSRSRYW